MKYKILIFLLVCSTLQTFAIDFIYKNIAYNILSENPATCATTRNPQVHFGGELVIPEIAINENTGKSYQVIEIGENSFTQYNDIERVVMPNSIRIIKEQAFMTNRIMSIVWSNNLERIEAEAFSRCQIRGQVVFPKSLKYIGKRAFDSSFNDTYDMNGELTRLIFVEPSKLTEIDDYAFNNCHGLTNGLKIPDSVIRIGNYAFNECTNLWQVSPDGRQFNPFEDPIKNGYPGVVIGNHVRTIGDYAFFGISSYYLVIPCSVVEIGNWAFYATSHELFRHVYALMSNPAPISSTTFDELTCHKACLHIPEGTYQKYASLPYWSWFMEPTTEKKPSPCYYEDLPGPKGKDVSELIDGYILLEKDETYNLNKLLTNPSRLSKKMVGLQNDDEPTNVKWSIMTASGADNDVSVDADGNLTANSLCQKVAVAYDEDDNVLGCIAVYVCPNVELRYPDGSSYKHLVLYNSLPELTVETTKGYDIAEVRQWEEGDEENEENHTVDNNEEKFPIISYSFNQPVTSNQVIKLSLNENTEELGTTGIAEAKSESGVKVAVDNRVVTVTGAREADVVEIVNVSGQLVYRGTVKTVELVDGGIYILSVGKDAFKLLVK